ncbi:hypothetical protein BGZ95_009525 [Linnemannia exigua]|uniref:Uncharacterized protein n=1 Tax=Linnemannia exigua TaxID=604196 RepID=A0AAD4DCM5_9FUNG|nr:hypothetical protein BGZ95_009525 [Linnemannia exigua]
MQYAPGQYCKNEYYMLDKACAILGAIAAGMWLIDFCLIFGFCGSSGQYGPYRRNEHHDGRNGGHRHSGGSGGMAYHQRRGQVGAEDYMADEDYYPAGGQPPPMRSGNDNVGGGATIYNEQDQYYYDLLEQRKRELEWKENRTLNDPKGHVQGPIPLSMQQSYYPTAYPDNVHQLLDVTTPEESTSATSPRYVIYPPGPACYVFDSSQQEYLPSFVNMAARIEQKQQLQHSHSLSSNSRGSSIATAPATVTSPGSPRHSVPLTPTLPPTAATGSTPRSHRVMVTGLGMEAITRRSSEIEAERKATAIALGSTDSLDTFDLTSSGSSTSLVKSTGPGLATTPTAVGNGRPQRIAMPSGGSYFPPEAVGSPTGSLKSFTSRKSSDSHYSHHSYQLQQHSPHHYLQHMHSYSHPHSPLGTEISNQVDGDDENDDISQLPQQPRQQAQGQVPSAKKPSLLKRKTSNLAIVTPQSPSSLHRPGSEDSRDFHSPSPPRSPYVGDF